MSYVLTITEKPQYFHATVSGQNTRVNVERYLEDVLRESIARNASRLLIEERLEGPRIGMADVFEIASERSDAARGHFTKIAYIDVNAKGDLMKFAETVAMNRGLPIKVFSTVTDAENWLREL